MVSSVRNKLSQFLFYDWEAPEIDSEIGRDHRSACR